MPCKLCFKHKKFNSPISPIPTNSSVNSNSCLTSENCKHHCRHSVECLMKISTWTATPPPCALFILPLWPYVLSRAASNAINLICILTRVNNAKQFKRQMQVYEEAFLRTKSIKGNMRRCGDECTCFFHPGLSELEGSGSQLSYILPQQCLQLKQQAQVAVLWRYYD